MLKLTPYEVMECRCRVNLKRSLDDVHAEIKRTCEDVSDPEAFLRAHPLAAMDAQRLEANAIDVQVASVLFYEFYSCYLFWASGKPIYFISQEVLRAIRQRPIEFARSDYEPLDQCAYLAFERGFIVDEYPLLGVFVHEEAQVKDDDIKRAVMFLTESEYEENDVRNHITLWPFGISRNLDERITEKQIVDRVTQDSPAGTMLDMLRAYLLVNKQSFTRRLNRRALDRSPLRCPCCGSRDTFHTPLKDYRDLPSSIPYYEVELLGEKP